VLDSCSTDWRGGAVLRLLDTVPATHALLRYGVPTLDLPTALRVCEHFVRLAHTTKSLGCIWSVIDIRVVPARKSLEALADNRLARSKWKLKVTKVVTLLQCAHRVRAAV